MIATTKHSESAKRRERHSGSGNRNSSTRTVNVCMQIQFVSATAHVNAEEHMTCKTSFANRVFSPSPSAAATAATAVAAPHLYRIGRMLL